MDVITIKIIMSGGKTAGHIMPAVLIMQCFKNNEYYYAGSYETLEKDLTKGYINEYLEYNLCGIKRKKPLSLFKTFFSFVKTYKKALKDIRRIKPDIVMGMGGNISAPLILAAKKEKVKTIIHEQNVIFGLTNNFLRKKVDLVLLSFDGLEPGIVVGNPVEERMNHYERTKINYPKNYHRVLFLGGSLGARVLNEEAFSIIEETKDLNIFYVVVVGNNYEVTKDFKNAVIIKYTKELSNIMQEVDLLVSRAGASTISEALNTNKKLILVPSPNVTNNHQEKNARYLEKKGWCKVVMEDNIKDLKEEILKSLYQEKEKTKASKGDAVWRIIEEIKKMI